MKYTLLEIVQNTLSSLGSDEVNSINDTTESAQIALIARSVFYDMASELALPEHCSIFQLLPTTDATKPTVMYRPDTAHSVNWIKYNVATVASPNDNFKELLYLPLNNFLNIVQLLKIDSTNVVHFPLNVNINDAITFYARNDIAPTYFTTFNDNTIVFDAYDSAVDSTLQKSKTQAFGGVSNIFTMSDSFTPPFDEQVFSLYVNEVKSLAWVELKEVPHGKAEQAVKRQRAALQRSKSAFQTVKSTFDRLPNYGRK